MFSRFLNKKRHRERVEISTDFSLAHCRRWCIFEDFSFHFIVWSSIFAICKISGHSSDRTRACSEKVLAIQSCFISNFARRSVFSMTQASAVAKSYALGVFSWLYFASPKFCSDRLIKSGVIRWSHATSASPVRTTKPVTLRNSSLGFLVSSMFALSPR
jgi:hypothetical protein